MQGEQCIQGRCMSVRILATGGTFDKEYDELRGRLFFKGTHVQEVLDLGRCKLPVAIEELMMVDSLEMTDENRQLILDRCLMAKENKIVVTHGTDTMEITARLLGQKIQDKTVILTGAMIPYKFGSSDGLFNLGSALAFCQALPSGVYIAMNGQVFPWDNVTKNKEIGEFQALKK